MIIYEEELIKFLSSLDVNEAEVAIYNRDLTDITDILKELMKDEKKKNPVLWGFFKKMVIADTAAVFVDAIFDQYQTYNGLAILGVLAYSAQLYGDFSGGMDVVIGIASMFGIEMDETFKRPYFSISMVIVLLISC